MGLLLVFAVGYVMGSRAAGETLEEVVDAANSIRESDEFKGLLIAVRAHAAHSLRGLATIVDRSGEPPAEPEAPIDLLERVRLIVGRR